MINPGLFSSNTPEWATPKAFFKELDAEFHFNLDPCATPENAKCERFFTQKDNGLAQDWGGGGRVFCNPPYGREISKWVRKCYEESLKPDTLVVMLIPARTDTTYFHKWIYHKAEVRFISGRLHFNESKEGAPFPSMVVIYDNSNTDLDMINGFSNETAPLSDKELACLPTVVTALKNAYGKENAIYNDNIRELCPELTEARVRKIINHIRTNGLVSCLIASSKGYYVAESEQEIVDYEESLRGRELAIRQIREKISDQRKARFGQGYQGRLF